MTAKRFYMDKNGDLYDKKSHRLLMLDFGYSYDGVGCKRIIDLLNELVEENTELHIQNDFLKDENQHMRDLVNENEQLKQQIQQLYKKVDDLRCGLADIDRSYDESMDRENELIKENEQLKEENKELRQYLSWQDMELEEMEDAKR